jgi:hypothetical protein
VNPILYTLHVTITALWGWEKSIYNWSVSGCAYVPAAGRQQKFSFLFLFIFYLFFVPCTFRASPKLAPLLCFLFHASLIGESSIYSCIALHLLSVGSPSRS